MRAIPPLAVLLTLAACGGGADAPPDQNDATRITDQIEKQAGRITREAENGAAAIEQALENEGAAIFENRADLLNETAEPSNKAR